VNDQGLHPALLYSFADIRNRPLAHILCWKNNGLLFHRVRACSLRAVKSVATALRRMEQKRVEKWLVARD
jgi:hypothetical protein